MAIRVTKTFTRPSVDTPLYRDEDMIAYVKQTYIDTGLRISFTRTESPDGLTVNWITEWRDQAAYDQFLNDTKCKAMYELRRAYNLANNITSGPPTVETL